MGKLTASLLFCLACTFCGAVHAAGPDPLPTSEELHKLYDDGQYQPVLQKLIRVLQLKGAAAQPYDRVDLLMLRGETLLRLKQQKPATDAFDAAVKEGSAESTTGAAHPPAEVALARSTALLAHKSRVFAYTPVVLEPGVKAEPISLLDADKRMDAFKALLTDTKADLTPKSKAAERGTTLAPIIELVRGLGDLRALESTVTGATKDSDALLSTLAERARGLMSGEVDRVGPKVDAISAAAHAKQRHDNASTSGTGSSRTTTYTTTYTLRGLYSADKNDLNQILKECEQILLASRDFADVTTGAQSQEFKSLAAKTEKVGINANTTLNDDYSTITSGPTSTLRR